MRTTRSMAGAKKKPVKKDEKAKKGDKKLPAFLQPKGEAAKAAPKKQKSSKRPRNKGRA